MPIETIKTILTLVSGLCWTLVYIEGIRVGIRDRSYAIPFYALALNLGWELLHAYSPRRKSRSAKVGLALGVVVSVLIAAAAYLYTTRIRTMVAANSIAVLPFINASGDPTMEYLSEGISESLINSLSQLPNMRVMARTTTFTFKGADSNPSAVGKQLGASAVLTGKIVQRDDNLIVQG